MAYPNDIFLNSNAKFYAFVDPKKEYNSHWDINWSFEYALSGHQHGICTFLTNFIPITGFPGQYLGYSGNANLSSYLVTENGDRILTEYGEPILIESEDGVGPNGILAIAFDTTGLFALSSTSRPGIGLGSIIRNSLIIRDQYDDVVVNVSLSSLSTDFILGSSGGFNYNTMRFRYAQAGNKLSIDYKRRYDNDFKRLTSINIPLLFPDNYPIVYTGLSFCSPISSNTISPSKMIIRNFHNQGNSLDGTYEYTTFVPITSTKLTNYTLLTGISSNP